MNTIEDIVTTHLDQTPGEAAGLIEALIEREQEAVDRLLLYADRLNLMAPVVVKVMAEVGLGEPVTPEMKKHIDDQYAGMLKEIEEGAEARIQAMRAMGAPIPEDVHAHVTDPLADDIDVVVPDSPEES